MTTDFERLAVGARRGRARPWVVMLSDDWIRSILLVAGATWTMSFSGRQGSLHVQAPGDLALIVFVIERGGTHEHIGHL